MKTAQPFFGVPTPMRAAILKEMGDRFAAPDQKSYARSVMALWRRGYGPHLIVAVQCLFLQGRYSSYGTR
jgi:hypothetical protein